MQDLIDYIQNSEKTTPVTVYLWEKEPTRFSGCREFCGADGCKILFGNWQSLAPQIEQNRPLIDHVIVQTPCRNSAVPLLDIRELQARIEPGAILRQGAQVGKNAVVMMGAVVNIGAQIGENTMIDMNAVLGARVQVGKNCHIGAGAVLSGVLEPPSARPVIVEDGVLIGANAVVLEGCRVGANAVVAAGSVVTEDVPPDAVVAGSPARIVKWKDERTAQRTALVDGLRQL